LIKPSDNETAAMCRVKVVERPTSRPGKLLLAHFSGRNSFLILLVGV